MPPLRVPLLISCGLALLGVAWLMATPPGAAFDEPAHYVKAVGAGGLDLRGEPLRITAAEREAFEELGRSQESPEAARERLGRDVRAKALRWQERTTRQFELPEELIGPELGCASAGVEVTGACLEQTYPRPPRNELGTYIGTYQPYVYIPAGLAARSADDPQTAVRLGRAAILVIALGLLALAVLLLWDPRSPPTSLLGLAAAITPMVVFVASALSASGPELAGGVCFAAALIRLTREGAQPGWVWGAGACAGAVLALSRPLGVPFVLLLAVSVALFAGPRAAIGRVRSGGRPALLAAVVLALGAAAGAFWQLLSQPKPLHGEVALADAIRPSLENLSPLLRHAVGVFGGLDAEMPEPGYLLWGALLAALLAAAFAAGGRHGRVSVAALLLWGFAVIMGLSLTLREIGPLQGRYALPVLVLVPLWAGELVHRNRAGLSPRVLRGLTRFGFAVAAAVHLLGWYANGRRFGVGDSGSWLYVFDADWAPPLGWLPWLALAVAGASSWLFTIWPSSAPPITPTPTVKISTMVSNRSSST